MVDQEKRDSKGSSKLDAVLAAIAAFIIIAALLVCMIQHVYYLLVEHTLIVPLLTIVL